jgi:N-acylneuraminate cytidylyltransferase
MNKITAIIPVRAGSTRLKNKNIAPFAGTNLLVNKINQLKQVQEIDWQKFDVYKRTERRAS